MQVPGVQLQQTLTTNGNTNSMYFGELKQFNQMVPVLDSLHQQHAISGEQTEQLQLVT